MKADISYPTRQELLGALQNGYSVASKAEKSRILDHFISLTGVHRKHAIRLLGRSPEMNAETPRKTGQRIYDVAVHEALVVVWEAADRICGKRLKAILPQFIDSMERHGHIHLDVEVRDKLLKVSAATIDRLLKPNREATKHLRKKKRAPSKPSRKISIKTFADWTDPEPGFLEIDFVVHCGGRMSGEIIHSLVATDVCSGWTEAVPLLVREQSLVTAGLDVLASQLPMPIRGINSDNDSAFINDTLLGYCGDHKIELTRSRAYKSNDQAWIEQKNGAVIRRLVGYERIFGVQINWALPHFP